jgi:aspartyl aminopeptidase
LTRKNKNGFRIPNPRSGLEKSQLTRSHPTIDRHSKKQLLEIDLFAEEYMKFLSKAKIAPETVDEIKHLFEEKSTLEDRLIIHPDQTAFAMACFGEKPMNQGLKIIYAHNDSPGLIVKVDPARFNTDFDMHPVYTGVELDTLNYGGIAPHQWTGKSLEIRGWSNIDGKRRKIKFPVYSSDIHIHTDTRQEEDSPYSLAHQIESLDLDTGFRSVKELLKFLKMKGEEDFARSRLFAIPSVSPKKIGPYYISGYGHDDKSGIYTAARAFLDTKTKPEYTTLIFGFDKEEVGSAGAGGAKSKFFEKIINQLLLEEGQITKLGDISNALKLDMYSKSLAINADVDAAGTGKEIDENRIDIYNISKMGYGPFLSCMDNIHEGDQVSSNLIDKTMGILREGEIIFHPIGSPVIADRAQWFVTMSEFMQNRGIPTVNLGIPVGALHSPEEILHKGDLYYAYKAYKKIIEG